MVNLLISKVHQYQLFLGDFQQIETRIGENTYFRLFTIFTLLGKIDVLLFLRR